MAEIFTRKRRVLLVFVGLVIFIGVGISLFYYIVVAPKRIEVERRKTEENIDETAYRESLLQNNPKALQQAFVDDLMSGTNDAYTKSHAYFVTHRFFDNGGNVYEIYDYVNSYPALAFLKEEAEAMQPEIFQDIRNGILSKTGEDRPLLAYLSYVEVLKNHGYTDVAAVATVANQYARMTYARQFAGSKMTVSEGELYMKDMGVYLQKSIEFAEFAQGDVVKILNGELTSQDVPARDILVGLNQYASALRFLELLEVDYQSEKTAREVFAFSMDYSKKFVPELFHFTSLSNASTLAMLTASTSEDIAAALYPILDLDLRKVRLSDASIINKVIDARFEPEPTRISAIRLGTYSKRNIVRLAEKSPEFKEWLMNSGWVETDFEITDPEAAVSN